MPVREWWFIGFFKKFWDWAGTKCVKDDTNHLILQDVKLVESRR